MAATIQLFQRTVCDCQACQNCCRKQPGHLLPGEMERIAEHLQKPLEEVKSLFWASPGALVEDTRKGRQYRIRTITPRFDRRKKACVFLSDEGKCSIHAVAPFGCAYFDTHMSAQEGQRRSESGVYEILNSPGYAALRHELPFADSYKPSGY